MPNRFVSIFISVSVFIIAFALPPTASACDIIYPRDMPDPTLEDYVGMSNLIFVSSEIHSTYYFQIYVDSYLKGLGRPTTGIGIGFDSACFSSDSEDIFFIYTQFNPLSGKGPIYSSDEVIGILPATQENIDAIIAITGQISDPVPVPWHYWLFLGLRIVFYSPVWLMILIPLLMFYVFRVLPIKLSQSQKTKQKRKPK